MLKHLGFDGKWLNWVQSILSSGTKYILLNGVPGKSMHCRRGVRQGDPLSPLLFVLAADLLQCIINKAHNLNLLSLPIENTNEPNFPVVQYVDDTILIVKASQRELFCLKGLLETFSQSTDLKVNYGKPCIVPINVSTEKMRQLAGVFGFIVGSLPFTYLGLHLGTTKPAIEDYSPLMNQVERRLTA